MAYDDDIGENAEMDYSIEEDDSQTFGIITDNETQEGIIILRKVQIFKSFSLKNSAKSSKIHILFVIIYYCLFH